MNQHPTERFSDRVAAYVRYRPGYPDDAIDWLLSEAGLQTPGDIADLGSGTGIFSQPLLKRGHRVRGVEPNTPMRQASEQTLNRYAGFTSIDGSAEATAIEDASIDLATAAQAYHWFAPARARAECARILRPAGKAALVWNDRVTAGDEFSEQYQALLLAHASEPDKVDHQRVAQIDLSPFFPSGHQAQAFMNAQRLDREGFLGRIESSSYMPSVDHPGYAPMVEAAEALFDRFARDGAVQIDYQTVVMIGTVRT